MPRVQHAVEADGVGLGHVGKGEPLAQPAAEVRVALDDDQAARRGNGPEQLGRDRPGPRRVRRPAPALLKSIPRTNSRDSQGELV